MMSAVSDGVEPSSAAKGGVVGSEVKTCACEDVSLTGWLVAPLPFGAFLGLGVAFFLGAGVELLPPRVVRVGVAFSALLKKSGVAYLSESAISRHCLGL